MRAKAFGAYEVVLIPTGADIGFSRPRPNAGPPMLEIYQGGRKRGHFVNRLTVENVMAEVGRGRVQVRFDGVVAGEIAREHVPGPSLEHPGFHLVTYERSRDLSVLRLEPADLDWGAVREWLKSALTEE